MKIKSCTSYSVLVATKSSIKSHTIVRIERGPAFIAVCLTPAKARRLAAALLKFANAKEAKP